MSYYPDTPQSIGKVLDYGFRLFKASFGKVIGYALAVAFLPLVSAVVMLGLPAQADQAPPVWFPFLIIIVALIFSLAGPAIMYSAMIWRMHQSAVSTAEPISPIKRALRAFFPVVLSSLLYIVAVGVGMILLLIPGIILGLSLYFYFMLIVVDKEGIIGALTRSHRLVWGNWWRTAAVMAVPFVLIIVLYTLATAIVYLITGTTGLGLQDPTLISNLITVPVAIISGPLLVAIGLVQLNDLKLRREGLDLATRMEQPA